MASDSVRKRAAAAAKARSSRSGSSSPYLAVAVAEGVLLLALASAWWWTSSGPSTTIGGGGGHAPVAAYDPDPREAFFALADLYLRPYSERLAANPVPVIREEDMTVADFLFQFVKQSRPAIIESAAFLDSPFATQWTDERLIEMIGDREINVEVSKGTTFDIYARERKESYRDRMTYAQFVDACNSRKDGKSYYYADQDLEESLRADTYYPMLARGLFIDQQQMWHGCGSQYTPIHYDGFENILFMLDGSKTFTIYPPWQVHLLYPYDDRSHYSAVDGRNPDLYRHPRFAEATPITVTVKAGQMLYLPAFWWHAVESSPGRNLAVNLFYVTHSIFADVFLEDMWVDPDNNKRNHLGGDLARWRDAHPL